MRDPTRNRHTQGSGQLTWCCGHPAPAPHQRQHPQRSPACPHFPSPAGERGALEHLRVCAEDFCIGTSGLAPIRVWEGTRHGRWSWTYRVRTTDPSLTTLFLCAAGTTVPATGWVTRRSKAGQGCKRLGEPLALSTRNGSHPHCKHHHHFMGKHESLGPQENTQ